LLEPTLYYELNSSQGYVIINSKRVVVLKKKLTFEKILNVESLPQIEIFGLGLVGVITFKKRYLQIITKDKEIQEGYISRDKKYFLNKADATTRDDTIKGHGRRIFNILKKSVE